MVRHDLALVIAPAPDMGARLDDEREEQGVRNLRKRRLIPHLPAFQHWDVGIGAGRFKEALVQYLVHRFERRRVQAEMRGQPVRIGGIGPCARVTGWQEHGSDRARAILGQLFERGEQRLGVGLGPGPDSGTDIFRPAPAFQQAFRKNRNGDLVPRKVPNRGNGASIAGPCQQDTRRNLTDFGNTCSHTLSAARNGRRPCPALHMKIVAVWQCPALLCQPPSFGVRPTR